MGVTKRKRIGLSVVSAALGLCLGCEEPPTPTPKAPEKPKETVPAEAASDPAPDALGDIEEATYAYSPIGKRDPFRSLYGEELLDASAEQLTELQRFEVDQLNLVAIISRIPTPYAMVEDPNGKGHTLTRGTLIGKNWGRVAEISGQCVVVKEEYRDYTGRKVTNRFPICLPKPEELKLD
jgi:type IV pilus assembly protein PilP